MFCKQTWNNDDCPKSKRKQCSMFHGTLRFLLRFIFSLRFLFMFISLYVFIMFNNRFIASGLNKSPFMLIEREKENLNDQRLCWHFCLSSAILAFEKTLTIDNFNYGKLTHCPVGTMPKHFLWMNLPAHEALLVFLSSNIPVLRSKDGLLLSVWYEANENCENSFWVHFAAQGHFDLRQSFFFSSLGSFEQQNPSSVLSMMKSNKKKKKKLI